MKGVNIIAFLLCLMLHCSIAEGSSLEELSATATELSSSSSSQGDLERKRAVTQNKILPLQADPVILNKNGECVNPSKDAKERNLTFSCCIGRKVKDRTGVRHRLLHLEHPIDRGNKK